MVSRFVYQQKSTNTDPLYEYKSTNTDTRTRTCQKGCRISARHCNISRLEEGRVVLQVAKKTN
jgi:hypothetical protein